MKEHDKDLMERYIYQVTRRVPKEQRQEISMELADLIEEMAEEAGMEQALEKLGDPAIFARQYRDEKNYVISPEYYDNYFWVLKIVMVCVAGSIIISALISAIQDGTWKNVGGEIIERALYSGMWAFGLVTLIFAVLERQHVKVELKEREAWSVEKLGEGARFEKKIWKPEQLSPLPDKKALISRSDCVVTILFTAILSGLLLLAPQLFGAYVFEDGKLIRTIPLFNLEQWNVILPFLLPVFLLDFVDWMIRLVTGRYCRAVLVSSVVLNAFQLILCTVVFKALPFWNPSFLSECSQAFGKSFSAKGDLLRYFGTDLFSNVVLAIIVISICCDLGVTIYKTLRYGDRKQ